QIGTVTLHVKGDPRVALATDAVLAAEGNGFVRETRLLVARVLRRLDLTARSFFAVVDEGSAYAGTLLELALAADRTYALNDPDHPVQMAASPLNGGAYPMSNGLTRLQTRFLGEPGKVAEVLAEQEPFDGGRADELGLATVAPDGIDW